MKHLDITTEELVFALAERDPVLAIYIAEEFRKRHVYPTERFVIHMEEVSVRGGVHP